MAERKAYRNSRTGGVRWSTNALGFPYVEAAKADTDDLPGEKAKAAKAKAKAKADASDNGT